MVGHVTAALKGSSTCGKSEQCIEYIVASDPRHGVRVQLGDLRISDGGIIFPVFFGVALARSMFVLGRFPSFSIFSLAVLIFSSFFIIVILLHHFHHLLDFCLLSVGCLGFGLLGFLFLASWLSGFLVSGFFDFWLRSISLSVPS